MPDYQIRIYKDEDYEMVRDLFKSSMEEQVPILYDYALKLPRAKVLLLGIPLVLFMAFKSFLITATAAAIILAIIWLGANYVFTSYVRENLKGDMSAIQQFYIERKGFCFWVAESHGKVVGMVAAQPYKGHCGEVELKRMYTRKEDREKGIGKALCQTLINFARDEGYTSVVLETSVVQYDAIKLYERVGFRNSSCYVAPFAIGKMLYFLILVYRYDIRITAENITA